MANQGSMSLQRAAQLLEVSTGTDLEELHRSFRLKARHAHPDLQRTGRQDEAHLDMVRLTEARTLLEEFWYANGGFAALFATGSEPDSEPPEAEAFEAATLIEIDAWLGDLEERFLALRERAKEAVYLYYRYKLYIEGQRTGGPGKGKFRDYQRTMDKALAQLSRLVQEVEKGQESFPFHMEEHVDWRRRMRIFWEDRSAFYCAFHFFESFARSVFCPMTMRFDQPRSERRIYMYYKEASVLINDALQELFMHKRERGQVRMALVTPKLQEASGFLSYLLKKFPMSSWNQDIATKGELVLYSLEYIKTFY